MVFYRKYRPQTIDDLDNAAVRKTLSSVLKNSSTHAFLFTGPKGLGKTSTARIIAKVVNCERVSREEKARGTSDTLDTRDTSSIEPCNKCDQCLSIINGTNLDVLEIDAASNRGIDEIRDLREKIRLAPVAAKIKVYIIDEVHMLTTEAFNALLKTLEEPPAHAMFILCTTEPHKVPATIISRSFHISFMPATEEELVRSFNRIVKAEKISITDEALRYVASMSDRGFRDGAKILEEVVALADGKKITKELVEETYKVSGTANFVSNMFEALAKKDAKRGLEIIKELTEKGIDSKYFIQQLMEYLHVVLLKKLEIQNTKYDIQNTSLDLNEIQVLFVLFSQATTEMKTAVLPQLPLELAIIEYCNLQAGETVVTEEKVQIKQVDNGVSVSSLRKQVGTIKKIQALYGDKDKKSEPEVPPVKISTVELMHSSPNGEITKEWLEHFWKNIIVEIKNYNHTISGVLRGCTIKSYDKKLLVIETVYKFHKDKLSEAKTLEALENVCKLLTGKVTEVKVELRA